MRLCRFNGEQKKSLRSMAMDKFHIKL
jgi:hypothetical protein